jgi:nitrite reductase/ring-hydroxylating ferredoxin subunit
MDVTVGEVAAFADPGRKVVDVEGVEIGVFRLGGAFYAYENICPHAGGPACQGKILPLTTEGVQPDRTSVGRVFSKDAVNVVCPWHGMEFDIRTGIHPMTRRYRLRPVAIRVSDGQVIVTLPAPAPAV